MTDFTAQIDRLTNDPLLIVKEWNDGMASDSLFRHLYPADRFDEIQRCGDGQSGPGCLTVIKGFSGIRSPYLDKVTEDKWFKDKVIKDDRVPRCGSLIQVETLPVFKAYQELFEKRCEAHKNGVPYKDLPHE